MHDSHHMSAVEGVLLEKFADQERLNFLLI